jgi:hypothetical protein
VKSGAVLVERCDGGACLLSASASDGNLTFCNDALVRSMNALLLDVQ